MYLELDEHIRVSSLGYQEADDIRRLLSRDLTPEQTDTVFRLLSLYGYAIVRNMSYPEKHWKYASRGADLTDEN